MQNDLSIIERMLEQAGYINVATVGNVREIGTLGQFQYSIGQGFTCTLLMLGASIIGEAKAGVALIFDSDTGQFLHHTMLEIP